MSFEFKTYVFVSTISYAFEFKTDTFLSNI